MSAAPELNDIPVKMVREHLREFPVHALPDGYRFRSFQPGDEAQWTNLHAAAEPHIHVTPELFDSQFGRDLDALHDRMFFLETATGQTVASISAWWEAENRPGERGRIHWVVVLPEHQRRGLAKAMMTRAMQRLAMSHEQAMLGTSCARPWAIKLYLDFGFFPDPQELQQVQIRDGWLAVQALLKHRALREPLNYDSQAS